MTTGDRVGNENRRKTLDKATMRQIYLNGTRYFMHPQELLVIKNRKDRCALLDNKEVVA